jgi:NAD-dependent dihydropyrimidine dehydrogenase PreA subunit
VGFEEGDHRSDGLEVHLCAAVSEGRGRRDDERRATELPGQWHAATLPAAEPARCAVYHRRAVTYVITEPCIGVKDGSCVDVCPVDCIHTTDDDTMFFIDPDECIDCGACEPECPVTAIFAEDAVPEQWTNYIQINADYFKAK